MGLVINKIDKLIDLKLKVERSAFNRFKLAVEDNFYDLENRLVNRSQELKAEIHGLELKTSKIFNMI